MIARAAARVATALAITLPLAAQSRLPGFRSSPWFDEQVLVLEPAAGVRASIHAPGNFDPERPTRVVLYATPNGSTLEHTLGAKTSPGIDWRYGIQHVAAQTRCVRALTPDENVVLVCVQAAGLSWPAWRAARRGGDAGIRELTQRVLDEIPGSRERVTLCAHSGGGSFIWGTLEHDAPIPASVDRIVLLDANYSFSQEKGHARALLSWLQTPSHRLVVVAYDDREVTYEGKRVIGPAGGTFRATQRMFDAFDAALEWSVETRGPFEITRALERGFVAYRHTNPKNLVLHTSLVGDMNGLLHALTLGTPGEEQWGVFGGPRAYDEWIQAEPGTGWDAGAARPFARRSPEALGGRAVFGELGTMSLAEREARLLAEIERGNVPTVLRRTVAVELRARTPDGLEHVAIVQMLPDYVAVGSDDDFVRVPLTPYAAQRVADRHGFILPTAKIVDAAHAAASVRLRPHPLTDAREAAATFVLHDDAIVQQLGPKQRGRSISGIKKDVVITARLAGTSGRVAIYGWHRADGAPIQPLYLGHAANYVDYSHGVRLVRRTALVDGQEVDLADVLADPELHVLFSDEGPIARGLQAYPR